MTPAEFKTFYVAVKKYAGLARQAKDEDDQEMALKLWRDIMGPRFPAAGTRKAEAASLIRPAVGVGLTFPSTPVRPNKPAGFA